MNDRLSLPFEDGSVALPENGTALALRATPRALYTRIANLTCVQGFKPVHDQLALRGLTVTRVIPNDLTVDLAIVEITRSKPETFAKIALGHACLRDGGTLVVDGSKTDGIESVLKAVKKLLPLEGVLSKAHGKVFWLTKSTTPTEFAAWSQSVEPVRNIEGQFTAAGMFSPDGADAGSALLAHQLPGKLSGKGADLGAGWGWLADQALRGNDTISDLALYEAEHTALECARMNVADARASFRWVDVVNLVEPAECDFVIMNPPFHQSRKADPELGRRFIRTAAGLLRPKGTLWMVANRQLAYEATLDAHFAKWDYLEQSPGFKTIRATRPKR